MRMSRCHRPAGGLISGKNWRVVGSIWLLGGRGNTFVSGAGKPLHNGFPVQYLGF